MKNNSHRKVAMEYIIPDFAEHCFQQKQLMQ